MERDKVNAVFCVKFYHVDKIPRCQGGKVSLIVDNTGINRNRPNHSRTFCCQLSSERLCIAVGGQIYNCLCAHISRRHHLPHRPFSHGTRPGLHWSWCAASNRHHSDRYKYEVCWRKWQPFLRLQVHEFLLSGIPFLQPLSSQGEGRRVLPHPFVLYSFSSFVFLSGRYWF